MPTSLFSFDSLRSLDLFGKTSIDDTIAVCLLRLKSLKIHHVSFESEEACENLIRGCPRIHYLHLNIDDNRVDEDDDDFTCIISSAYLRRLEIYFERRSSMKLKTSSLEYLEVHGGIPEISVEKSLSSLVEANFDIRLDEHDVFDNSIVEAVRAFDCAKFLTLSADVMQYSDNLHYQPRWTTPVEVPRCFSNSLKNVQYYGYTGLEDEREMIRYMLKYESSLEVMLISCERKEDGEKLELLQEICEFPRKSPACKVQFYVWPSKRQFKPL